MWQLKTHLVEITTNTPNSARRLIKKRKIYQCLTWKPKKRKDLRMSKLQLPRGKVQELLFSEDRIFMIEKKMMKLRRNMKSKMQRKHRNQGIKIK